MTRHRTLLRGLGCGRIGLAKHFGRMRHPRGEGPLCRGIDTSQDVKASDRGIPMSGESHEVIHPKFRMWLRPDGIVQLVWRSGAELGLEDAVAAIDAMTKLTDGRRSPLLVDIHDAGQQDRAARMEFVRAGGLV